MNEIEKFWVMICSDNEGIREEGFDKWREFDKNNPRYLETIRENFSKTFYNEYQEKTLHDFHILNIETLCNTRPPRKTEIKLLLHDFYEEYGKDLYFYLIYGGVQSYVLYSPNTGTEASWYKDIFEVTENNMLKHRIALIGDAYIEVTFKSIRIIKTTQ